MSHMHKMTQQRQSAPVVPPAAQNLARIEDAEVISNLIG
jgi:hypothetical protein